MKIELEITDRQAGQIMEYAHDGETLSEMILKALALAYAPKSLTDGLEAIRSEDVYRAQQGGLHASK